MRSGQACGRSCMRACMYALSSVTVHRSPLASEYSVKPWPGFTSKSSARCVQCGVFLLPSGFFAQLPAVWAAVWASVCVYQSSLHLFPWKTILHVCAYSTTQWRCRVWLTLAALPHTLTHQGCCLGPFGFFSSRDAWSCQCVSSEEFECGVAFWQK